MAGQAVFRGVAQPGSAHGSGPWCRRFKSSRPDFLLVGTGSIFVAGRTSEVTFPGICNRKILLNLAPFLLTEWIVNGNLNGKDNRDPGSVRICG